MKSLAGEIARIAEPAAAPPPPPLPEAPRDPAAQLKVLRRYRALRMAKRVALFVCVPTVLAALYYGLIASDQFESISLFTVNTADTSRAFSMESLVGIMAASPATRDTLAVRDYILSRDMLARLEQSEGFIEHYKNKSADMISRLASNATFEDAHEDYRQRVRVDYDSVSGVVTMKVRAYSAEKAQRFSEAILKFSEEKVNKLSERSRQDQMDFARSEVKQGETRLASARQRLLEVQQTHGELNPEAKASATMTIREKLEGDLAATRAELNQARAMMKPDAPRVIALQDRERAVLQQVQQESRRLVNPKDSSALSGSIVQFESAVLEKEFAQRAYQSALTSLEVARTEAVRQHSYLVVIANPSFADESLYPRRWMGTLTVFLCSFLILGVGSLLVSAVKEHARI